MLFPILRPVLSQALGPVLKTDRRNLLPNPNFIGGAAPNTSPTGMALGGGTSIGVARTLAFGTTGGIPYAELALVGTCTATTTLVITLAPTTTIATANGQALTQSASVGVPAGDPAKVVLVPALRMYTAAGAVVGSSGLLGSALTLTSSLVRSSFAGTINQATAAFVQPGWRLTLTLDVTYAETIRFAGPQLERGLVMTDLQLPPAGTMWS